MLVPFHPSITHALTAVEARWDGSHLVDTDAGSVKLKSTELGLWPGVCVGGMRSYEHE